MLSELFDQFDIDGRCVEVSWMSLRESKLREYFEKWGRKNGLTPFWLKEHPKVHLCKLHGDEFPQFVLHNLRAWLKIKWYRGAFEDAFSDYEDIFGFSRGWGRNSPFYRVLFTTLTLYIVISHYKNP